MLIAKPYPKVTDSEYLGKEPWALGHLEISKVILMHGRS